MLFTPISICILYILLRLTIFLCIFLSFIYLFFFVNWLFIFFLFLFFSHGIFYLGFKQWTLIFHRNSRIAIVIWRLDWGWWICFQDDTLTRLLAGGLSFLLYAFSRTAWVSSCHGHWLPQTEWPEKEETGNCNAFNDLVLEVIPCAFIIFCFLETNHWVWPTFKGGELSPISWSSPS